MKALRSPVVLCAALAVALGACGEESEGGGGTSATDPSVERLEAACRTYRDTTYKELPPAAPADYAAYLRERRRLVEQFLAAVREAPSEGAGREARGRLLAAASRIQGAVNDTQRTTTGRNLASGLYDRGGTLEDAEQSLDAAAAKAGVRCRDAQGPSAELRDFRQKAGEVCEASGRVKGVPRGDAELIRRRVDGHARLTVPSDATGLERETLAAQRAAARVAAGTPSSEVIRDADARYIALAVRTSTGWSRQGVAPCADLPLPDV